MYALVEDNNITQFINQPKSIVVGDVRYPAKIFQLWSQSEKQAIGLYEVVVDKTNYKDPEYYNNTNSSYTFADGQVTESWGTATAKDLNDKNGTDEDGNELDPVVIIKGLKSQKKDIVKQQASGLLSPTDWYVIRKYEDSTKEIPTKITNYRTAVRAAADTIETKINAASNMTNFIKLFDSADSTGLTEINKWPEQV